MKARNSDQNGTSEPFFFAGLRQTPLAYLPGAKLNLTVAYH
jgi:hypothetical protein